MSGYFKNCILLQKAKNETTANEAITELSHWVYDYKRNIGCIKKCKGLELKVSRMGMIWHRRAPHTINNYQNLKKLTLCKFPCMQTYKRWSSFYWYDEQQQRNYQNQGFSQTKSIESINVTYNRTNEKRHKNDDASTSSEQ